MQIRHMTYFLELAQLLDMYAYSDKNTVFFHLQWGNDGCSAVPKPCQTFV